MSESPMTPERLAEVRDLLRYESSIAFYSHRAKESMLLLLAEAEAAARLRARVAELEAELEKLVRWHGEDSKTITGLVARVERRQAELVALRNDALSMRGLLAPADGPRKVPFELGETLTPAVDWLIARIAELETDEPAEDPDAAVRRSVDAQFPRIAQFLRETGGAS